MVLVYRSTLLVHFTPIQRALLCRTCLMLVGTQLVRCIVAHSMKNLELHTYGPEPAT